MASVLSEDARAALVAELRALLGDRATSNPTQLEHHSHGESWHAPGTPDAVVFPVSTEEVSAIVRIAGRYGAPMVPFGIGSSLEGHVNAIHGGVSIDLSRMNRVLRVSVEDLDCHVEAGVTHRQLNKALANTGVSFWVDPGADATIGGMAATRASGTTAVRYGTMREVVLGLTVVLAGGGVIHTGGRARKSSSGYDLTRLFVGSEGTLGVITEATLRLYGLPDAVSAAVCQFDTMEGAVESVITIMQLGVPVARIELLDEAQIDAVNRYSRLAYPLKPTIFFEFHGTSAAAVAEHAQTAQEITADHGGSGFQWAATTEERTRLWQARHHAFYAAVALRPGAKPWTTDVCVPISRLADCILETRRDVQASRLVAPLMGHVGDGNFHLVFVIDPENPEELAAAREVNSRLIRLAQAMGGTCTGEHGVGIGKMDYLAEEHGAALDVMRAIKRALDPHNLMNPGKMFAPES
ncbi:MAG: lactate dehydrogenase [Acidobacteria bacterium RIFCSPLOWO2_02_FULL_68_18]|nr:MAG: lactate dehydrogenase [Acidobacteria bacterium RIFCSPLOWO2_02_FULL_68_18]OFW50822.1 MAG: lactate dehydrogenase [Acidobacteria bacterium RIFCSPLOWO2_12_FULL_68_19]